VSGTNGNAVFLVPTESFGWTQGAESTTRFALPSGWSVLRCNRCGSPLPISHDGKRFWVPAGLMNEPLDTSIKIHIFAGSKADWDEIPKEVTQFEAWPPGYQPS
jgi:hypothetical protein